MTQAIGCDGKQGRDLALLDFLRWSSACLVAAGHLRDFLFVDYPAVGHAGLALRLFYAVTGLGHEAVMVFFVLSGYLVGGGLVRDGLGRASVLNYFIHRFSRIYIVLAPALALTFVLDMAGAQVLPGLYRAPGEMASLNFAAIDRDSLPILACNLANLQDAFCPAFGSNGPLWSLAYEWFYYLTFPLILTAITRFRSGQLGSGQACLFAAGLIVAIFVFPAYSAYYAIWLFGVAARSLRTRSPSKRCAYAAGIVTLALFAIARARIAPAYATDILIGLSLAIVLAQANLSDRWRPLGTINSWLAGFSYSLYVIHFPMVVFIHALLVGSHAIGGRLMPGWTAFALFAVCGIVIYASAFIFSLGTESQTRKLRAVLAAWLPKPRQMEAASSPPL